MFATAQRNVPGGGRGLDWLTRELILLEGDVVVLGMVLMLRLPPLLYRGIGFEGLRT